MNLKGIDYYERKGKFIVDYLPKEVSDEKKVYVRNLEELILREGQVFEEKNKIRRIILKLLSYFNFDVYSDRLERINLKEPRDLLNYMEDDRNKLGIHLERERCFIELDLERLSFMVYNPSSQVKDILLPLVRAEGLFYRKA